MQLATGLKVYYVIADQNTVNVVQLLQLSSVCCYWDHTSEFCIMLQLSGSFGNGQDVCVLLYFSLCPDIWTCECFMWVTLITLGVLMSDFMQM